MSKIKTLSKNKYVINLLWTFFEKIVHLISVLVVGILLARYLGPEQFGTLSYVQSYIAIFGFLVGLGLDSITVREIVKDEKNADVIVGTSFFLKLVMSLIIIFLVNISIDQFNDNKQINLLLTIFSLTLLYQAFYVFVNYFQAKVNIKYISRLLVISDLILIISKIFLIMNQSALINFIIVDVVVFMLLGISFFLSYRFDQNSKDISKLLKFDFLVARKLLKDSWPLMISSGAIVLYMRLDQIMIKEMLSLKDLGNYAVAVRISEAWYFIPMMISGVLFPSIIKAKDASRELYIQRLEQLFFITIWIAIFISSFIYIFSGDIINLLFGNQFNMSSDTLGILAFAGIFVSMGYVNGKWMVVENYTQLSLIRNLYGLCINICLNIILIPIYGINGAAISTLVAIFVSSNFFFLFHQKTRKIFYLQNIALFNYRVIRNFIERH